MKRLQRAAERSGSTASSLAASVVRNELKRIETGYKEGQMLRNGPSSHPEETYQRLRAKYGLPDLSGLTRDELSQQAEALLEELPAETIAEAERQGLL